MNSQELIQALSLAFAIGLIAYVYAVIMTDPDQIFESFRKWAERVLPHWLFYPLIGCEKCVAGQLALWTLIFKLVKNYWLFHPATGLTTKPILFILEINFISGALVITGAIFFTTIFKKIHSWTKR